MIMHRYEVPQKLAEIEAVLAGLYEAVDRIADERRREPRQDLLTALVHASDGDRDRLDPDELRANVAGLVLAGQDSTRGQLGLALEIFARHSEQWSRIAIEPELAGFVGPEALPIRFTPAK